MKMDIGNVHFKFPYVLNKIKLDVGMNFLNFYFLNEIKLDIGNVYFKFLYVLNKIKLDIGNLFIKFVFTMNKHLNNTLITYFNNLYYSSNLLKRKFQNAKK